MLAAAILNAESNEREILENALRRYLSEHTLRMEVYAYAHAQDFWEARQQRYFELLLVMVRQGEGEGINLARQLRGCALIDFPPETALGALALHISTENRDFQPMNINFGLLPPMPERIRGKRER